MSREEDARATVSMLNDISDKLSTLKIDNETFFKASVVALLSDISLSLAVIADKMEEKREVKE